MDLTSSPTSGDLPDGASTLTLGAASLITPNKGWYGVDKLARRVANDAREPSWPATTDLAFVRFIVVTPHGH